ncbi:MAG: LL-diaminopimelate aminotransferase [Clostridia bacterium]|nr:LL-diaminopimelate aminotransferase [Clostridia bacterium]
MKVNENFGRMKPSYLFSEIAKRTAEFRERNPQADIIRLGIGDVTRPLCPAVVEAGKKATEEMGVAETFRGYAPDGGYPFIREAVSRYYGRRGVNIAPDEIFVSDGAKCDVGNILDIFASGITALVPDPVYPVYVDTNIMAGNEIAYIGGNAGNGFLPVPDETTPAADVIYICSPNNPTGAVYNAEQLKKWVDYARNCGGVILFDAAYEGFVQGDLPHSIFEIEGARECAIEFGSLSKTAGFTGTRCAYTVVPKELKSGDVSLNALWARRSATKFNGVSYIIQRMAEAALSDEGLKEIAENLSYYKENARIISTALDELGIEYTGGRNSPYIWLKCPNGMGSWEFFDLLLSKANVVGTPGAGFGVNGEGYFRLTAFGDSERTAEAAERIKKTLREEI